jgi:cytochrome c oxidase subunit 3
MMVGVSSWLNGAGPGFYVMLTGVAVIVFMVTGWFAEVIGESQRGLYNEQVDRSFRQGMFWFIFSEVMFFAAFFGALFYARNMSIPWLGGSSNNFFTNVLLWQGFESTWPTNGPGNVGGDYEAMPAMGLPLINTALLLTSSVTVTIAHHALIAGKRAQLAIFLASTFILGFIFVGLQAYEYVHAYQDLNLRLTSGIYGSTFFMLTRLPRHARHDRRDHADDNIFPGTEGALHARQAFRFRGGGLVLALRRRGLDRPVRLCVLAVKPLLRRSVRGGRCGARFCQRAGSLIQPKKYAATSTTTRTRDRATRICRARSSFGELASSRRR